MQKFIARVSRAETNGAISWAPGGPFDCVGHFAKIQKCPIEIGGVIVDRLTCYATGYADTFFSVPACTRKRGKYVSGFFTVRDDGPVFIPHDKHKTAFQDHPFTEDQIADFVISYKTCALWSSIGDDGEPLDNTKTIDNISSNCAESMRADCVEFMRANVADLIEYESRMTCEQWRGMERAGHDFWLTRNGHGAGFWDRGLGDLGERLSEATKARGEVCLYIGDDGLIHGG